MIDIDAPSLIEVFGATYTFTRRAAATFTADSNAAVPGATSTFTALACFWPADGRDLQRLPELRRAQQTFAGVCAVELLVGGEGSANEADLVTIEGVLWECQTSSAWPNVPGFYSVVVQRPNVG